MKLETWKEVPGTDGRYHVSDKGNIFDHLKAKICKTYQHNEHFNVTVTLLINGVKKAHPVCWLIAEAFLDVKSRKQKLVFMDGNRANLRLSNIQVKPYEPSRKPINHRDKNGILQGIFYTLEEAAKAVGSTDRAISNAIADKTMHKGYYWDRKEIRYISQGAFVGKTTSYHEGIDEMDIGITPNYNVKHLTGEELQILNSLIFAELEATNRNYLNNLKQAG